MINKKAVSILNKSGLSDNGALVYLDLIESGDSTVGEISKRTNLQRSTIYYLIRELQNKGLVSNIINGKRNLFHASDPKTIEKNMYESYKQIKSFIPKLIKVQNKDETKVMFFKGYNGLRAAYNEVLDECKKGDEILVMGARGGEDVSKRTYRSFFKNLAKRRIEKGINQRLIINFELKKTIGKIYQKLPKTKVRYLKQHTLAPLIISPNLIAIVIWETDPSIFIIKNKNVIESFKQYFDNLWSAAK